MIEAIWTAITPHSQIFPFMLGTRAATSQRARQTIDVVGDVTVAESHIRANDGHAEMQSLHSQVRRQAGSMFGTGERYLEELSPRRKDGECETDDVSSSRRNRPPSARTSIRLRLDAVCSRILRKCLLLSLSALAAVRSMPRNDQCAVIDWFEPGQLDFCGFGRGGKLIRERSVQ
jgi:hypothetical protein